MYVRSYSTVSQLTTYHLRGRLLQDDAQRSYPHDDHPANQSDPGCKSLQRIAEPRAAEVEV